MIKSLKDLYEKKCGPALYFDYGILQEKHCIEALKIAFSKVPWACRATYICAMTKGVRICFGSAPHYMKPITNDNIEGAIRAAFKLYEDQD